MGRDRSPTPPYWSDHLKRAAVEQALTDTFRAAIGDMCEVLGVPRDRWDCVPGFRGVAEVIALYRRADELRAKHGYSQERAMLDAGAELGLDSDTVSRRLRQWLRSAFDDAA